MPGVRAGHFVFVHFILCDAQGTHTGLSCPFSLSELHRAELNSFLAVVPRIEIPHQG
jgi:hypothetical protein